MKGERGRTGEEGNAENRVFPIPLFPIPRVPLFPFSPFPLSLPGPLRFLAAFLAFFLCRFYFARARG
jgi:hypothetical protein